MTTTPSDRLPLPPETLERLGRVSTATLATQLFKLGFRSRWLHGLRPLSARCRLVGEAVTVRFVPTREDLGTYEALADPGYPQRRAIEEIAPGQVLVLGCRGIPDAAAVGDILIARLHVRGAAGVVADGGIRDYPVIRTLDFPVYALGPAAPAHVARHLAVDVDVPIGCAEVLVLPGDLMVGDEEGVICVPRGVATDVASRSVEQDRLEAFVLEKIRAGAPLPGTYPPSAATRVEYEAWRDRPP